MPQRPFHDDERDGSVIHNPILHDADDRDLRFAADALRDRTMTLEPNEPVGAKKLVAAIMAVVAVVAAGTIIFRTELKTFLGLM